MHRQTFAAAIAAAASDVVIITLHPSNLGRLASNAQLTRSLLLLLQQTHEKNTISLSWQAETLSLQHIKLLWHFVRLLPPDLRFSILQHQQQAAAEQHQLIHWLAIICVVSLITICCSFEQKQKRSDQRLANILQIQLTVSGS